MSKKLTRGISREFAEAFKKCELYKLYQNYKDELYLGVRNESLNLYYNCDSIPEIRYDKRTRQIVCKIDKYYLDGIHYEGGAKEKIYKTDPTEICQKIDLIKYNSDHQSDTIKNQKKEKKAQSKLVLLNNANKDSHWYCVDIEYKKGFPSKAERMEADFDGRFDIIALSKATPHRLAIIELKYGSGSMKEPSGIYTHVKDFSTFNKNMHFQQELKQEICEIVQSQIDLDIPVPFKSPEAKDIGKPEFYFITLDNNAEGNASTPKQTMSGYLFDDMRWDCKRKTTKESVQIKFGDITKKDNKNLFATFLFSRSTIDTLAIKDIIDGEYDERINPK